MADSGAVSDTSIVRVQPADFEIAVPTGTSLMQAAQAIGVRWPNVCNGQALCGVCAVEVLEGSLSAIEPRQSEAQMLARLAQRPRNGGFMRLACQLQPNGSMTVHKLAVRAPTPPEQ